MEIDLKDLVPWNPFKHHVWRKLTRPISKREVTNAIAKKRFLREWRNTWSRKDHIQRIAWFVVTPWHEPISIDVGVPELGCNVDWIVIDGNHRLAAAFYREDTHISADVSGSVDLIQEMFGACGD